MMPQVARKLILLIALIAAPASCFANGDMGLAYQMFDYRYWYVYVAFTVIFEAWYMGVKSDMGWSRAIGTSLFANLVSATLPMCFCVVLLHQSFVGSPMNPNPFMNAVVLLFGFGVISAFIEGAVWQATAKRFVGTSNLKVLTRMLKAQMIVATVGLVIFLIPERPYLGLQVGYRTEQLKQCLGSFLANQDGKGRLPEVSSAEDLARRFPRKGEDYWDEEQWVCVFIPDYTRFAFGDTKQHVYELNPKVSGLNIVKYFEEHEEIWILRARNPGTSTYRGYVLNRNETWVYARTSDPKRLGYEEPGGVRK